MARRLNKKVLVVVLGVLVAGGGAVLGTKLLGRGAIDGKKLEAQGDAAFAKADYNEALLDYRRAQGADPTNTSLKVKIGDTFVKLTRDDANLLGAAHNEWLQAISLDPKNKPALERLLASVWEQIELSGDAVKAESFAMVRDRTRQLLAVDPGNLHASVLLNVSTVRQWLAGQPVPDVELQSSFNALAELIVKDPANAEPPYWLAKSKLRTGEDLVTTNQMANALMAFSEAGDLMTRAVKGQEKSPLMQLHAYQIFSRLSRVDSKSERKHADAAGQAIAAALSNSSPATPNLDRIISLAADWQFSRGKPEEAKKILKKYFDENPDSQRARLFWAKTLGSTREDRAKAIEILSRDVPLPKDAVGVGVMDYREQQAKALFELVRIRLIDFSAEKDANKRKAQLVALDVDMDKLRAMAPRSVRVLGLDGQVLLAKERNIEAIRALEDAYAAMTAANDKDYEMMFTLARAHATVTQQPGRARQLCEEIVRENPATFMGARALLAQLLLNENRAAAADVHIQYLKRNSPDLPELKSLESERMIVENMATPMGASKVLEAMLETNNKERWQKVTFAKRADKPDVQIQLLNDIVRDDPKDVSAARLLAALYRQQQLPDRAKQVIEEGLAATPDDVALKLMKAELAGATPEQLRAQALERIMRSTDPFQRNLMLYDFNKMAGGDSDAALASLNAALKLKPDDIRVRDMLFREYISRKRFEEARPHLDFLVKERQDQADGRLYRHRFAISRGEYEEAERLGKELVDSFKEFAYSWMALGEAQEAQGKWDEAARSFGEVLARQPANYEALRALVDTLYNAGRTDEAEARLKDMRQLFSTDLVVRELYLNHLANFGKPELAIPDREEMLRRAPKDPWNYLALAATYFKNAQRLAALNNLDSSKAHITAAFQVLSRGRDQFPDDTRFYFQVAEIHQYSGKLDQGEAVLQAYADREMKKQLPDRVRPDPWLALADYFMRTGQQEKVVGATSEALVRSGNSMEVRLRLVSAYLQLRNYVEATHLLDEVRDSKDPRIARQRLEILVAQGNLADAERDIRAALRARDGADLRNLLASVLIDTDRAELALPEIARALQLESTNETSRYLRGLAFSRKHPPDLDNAINELVDLRKSASQNLPARLLLADLYEKSGRKTLAIQELDDALQKLPGSRELRLQLVRLYRTERPPKYVLAFDLIQKAETDPVLRSDASWPREEAMLYREQRRYPEAIMKMTQAINLAPGNADYRRERIDLNLAFNDLAAALIDSDRLLRDGIDTWWLRQQRGVALARQVTKAKIASAQTDPLEAAEIKDLQRQALSEFDRALVLIQGMNDPARAEGIIRTIGTTVGYGEALDRVAPRLVNDPDNQWRLLAIALKRSKGDFPGAITDVERLLSDPVNNRAHPSRRVPLLRAAADIYQAQTQPNFAKARDWYAELLTLAPDDLIALNNISFILAEGIKPPDAQSARAYSERAYEVTRATNDPSALIIENHGWILVLCGMPDLNRGVQILKNVVEQNPMFVEGRYHLGEALMRTSPTNLPQAEREFTECLRLMDEEEKLGSTVDAKLRQRIQLALAKVKESIKVR